MAILKTCSICLNVSVVGHAELDIFEDFGIVGSLLKMKIRLSGCQVRPEQHAFASLHLKKSLIIVFMFSTNNYQKYLELPARSAGTKSRSRAWGAIMAE